MQGKSIFWPKQPSCHHCYHKRFRSIVVDRMEAWNGLISHFVLYVSLALAAETEYRFSRSCIFLKRSKAASPFLLDHVTSRLSRTFLSSWHSGTFSFSLGTEVSGTLTVNRNISFRLYTFLTFSWPHMITNNKRGQDGGEDANQSISLWVHLLLHERSVLSYSWQRLSKQHGSSCNLQDDFSKLD